jgi:hypothetical protein
MKCAAAARHASPRTITGVIRPLRIVVAVALAIAAAVCLSATSGAYPLEPYRNLEGLPPLAIRFDFDEDDSWWRQPSTPAPDEPEGPDRIPYDPTENYISELSHFMGLAVTTIEALNPHVKLTTNFGRFPFDESAIADGKRFFDELPDLDITGVTIYPDYDSVVLNRIPQIISEFGQLGRPVEIAEIGVCTARHTPDQQRILLTVYFDMLSLIPPSRVFVYELQDRNDSASSTSPCEATFGLRKVDGAPKPGYDVFIANRDRFPTVGVTARLLHSEGTNLDAEMFRRNVDDLVRRGVRNINVTTEWWKVSTITDGRLYWDEEKWNAVAGAVAYAASKGLRVRLHTSPPWTDGTTREEYEAVVVEYYERIATLTIVDTIQIYNEANQFRFTDYAPVTRLF